MLQWDIHGIYPLVIFNIANWKPWPIEIDDFPQLETSIYFGDFPWLC